MGAWCGNMIKELKGEKKDNEVKPNDEPEYKTQNSRFESISEEDAVICKLKIQACRLEKKIKDLEKKENAYADNIKKLIQENKKDEAKYNMALKKYVINYQNGYRDKLLFIEKQIGNIESLKDTVEFTKLVAETNRIAENLLKKTDKEELEIALVLMNETKQQNEEINAYLEDDELNEEFDQFCKEVEEQGYNQIDNLMISHMPAHMIKQKYSDEKNNRIRNELS